MHCTVRVFRRSRTADRPKGEGDVHAAQRAVGGSSIGSLVLQGCHEASRLEAPSFSQQLRCRSWRRRSRRRLGGRAP
jgi:hypothetical protein